MRIKSREIITWIKVESTRFNFRTNSMFFKDVLAAYEASGATNMMKS